MIEERRIGHTVPAEDVDALEEALVQLLSDTDAIARCRRAANELADEFRWSSVLEPLVQFCRAPRRAPDLVLPEMAELVGTGRSQVTRPLRMVHWREDVQTFAGHLKRGELKTMVRKGVSRVRAVV